MAEMRYLGNGPMMRISTFLALVSLMPLAISSPCLAENLKLPQNTPVTICFSPKGGCTDAIVNEIDHAKTEILVQAYSFTSAPKPRLWLPPIKMG